MKTNRQRGHHYHGDHGGGRARSGTEAGQRPHDVDRSCHERQRDGPSPTASDSCGGERGEDSESGNQERQRSQSLSWLG